MKSQFMIILLLVSASLAGCVEKEIEEICNKFFGNTNVNQANGLMQQYKLMKEYVTEHKLIGLFLI